jgi:hypothetical protein
MTAQTRTSSLIIAIAACSLILPGLAMACAGGHGKHRPQNSQTRYSHTPTTESTGYQMRVEDDSYGFALVIEDDTAAEEKERLREIRRKKRATKARASMKLQEETRREKRERRRRFRSASVEDDRTFKPQLDSRRIARIMAALHDEPFSSEQLSIITEAGQRFDMTVRQAIRLVEQLTFEDDRVEALARLYPALLDEENFIEVYSLLTFSSSRRELRKRVNL